MIPLTRVLITAVFLLLILLTGCGILPSTELMDSWKPEDLRLLDPVDASLPDYDLIAAYLRESGAELQIRLDLLDAGDMMGFDLYLALDFKPGGVRDLLVAAKTSFDWDLLLEISAKRGIRILDSSGEIHPGGAVSVVRDPIRQALLISLDQNTLFKDEALFKKRLPLQIQAILTSANERFVQDQLDPIRIDAPPPQPAHYLLAFWDVFPAYTPLTALRRWDGAHTGPLGGRHGLFNLLRTARAAQTPVILLDLNQPTALSALDFAGGLGLVREMQAEGLLLLSACALDQEMGPGPIPDEIQKSAVMYISAVSARFGIEPSGFLYLPDGSNRSNLDAEWVFRRQVREQTGKTSQTYRLGGSHIIPLIDAQAFGSDPAGREGLSLEWKKQLLNLALDAPEKKKGAQLIYYNLGGSLPGSAWGDPQSARATFFWLREHPWVQQIRPTDLRSAVAQAMDSTFPIDTRSNIADIDQPLAELTAALKSAPDNQLGEAAWEAYFSLFAPIYPASDTLQTLRSRYSGLVWSLLQAANWAQNPEHLADCRADPDRDGHPECILTSDAVYAQFEIDEGSLTFLFAITSGSNKKIGEVHQLVGPGSQLIAGLSDPTSWHLEAGLRSDPFSHPGAFVGPERPRSILQEENTLTFLYPDIGLVKRYRLIQHGIEVEYLNALSYPPVSIALLLDPWRRFYSNWGDELLFYSSETICGWKLANGWKAQVKANAPLICTTFLNSRDLFSQSEDPNLDLPAGGSLPFPLSLIEAHPADPLFITISLSSAP